ncbi:AraC family transcriptional regulator [Paraflavitalea sp. CAU 1676]|uniref:AraC family transcriptional regulator n=1 Tax=Paraflavitalea sp. CAU 1676 TaxID=3032598 RepID=UPI0023DC5E29|nr:AraC family transcriptional regulator [Paraflavitalea sp. CAU 1676]MDF2193508.1 AraC family transcriptional regulator [Paraflavitalea sp. CAU 1676]
MKPVLRQITATPDHSFLVRKDTGSEMVNNWHYHPEVELLYIKRSSGTWMIGDHIGHFNSGDVVMIGSLLPHCFRHEYDYVLQKEEAAGESICVKFMPESLGEPFLSLPETKVIRDLLARSNNGLRISGKTKQHIGAMIDKMVAATPARRLVYLLTMLEEIAASRDYSPLSSTGFMQTAGNGEKDRIKKVFEFTFNNYRNKITIEEVAALVNMTRQSFCRYFKSKTNKTYVRFLMEVRIGYACRLLVEDEKNVSEICYESGYGNLSHFIHQFKLITRKKPLEYKKEYLRAELAALPDPMATMVI